MTDQPTPSTLTDADLLAWAVVLGYREQQQRDGITLLLLPLPPCPTCKSAVLDGTASWVREASLEELTINMRPCGHAHRASLLDLEAMQDHVAGMLFTLTEADNGRRDVDGWLPAGRRWTTDDIGREAHARVGQPQQAESDQPRGPVDWARHQAAQRETAAVEEQRETETLKAAIARVRTLAAELFVTGATDTERAIGRQLLNALQQPEAHNAGPTVAECAEADRHWPLEKAGE